jgi:hypothetical protein
MLHELTADSFAPLQGSAFLVEDAGVAPCELRLTSIERLVTGSANAWQSSGPRTPFSLVFSGSADYVLPQRIYTLRHERLAVLQLFLVPIRRDAEGTHYEAVFT